MDKAQLFDEVLCDRLQRCLNDPTNEEAFKQAMEAVDKDIEYDKMYLNREMREREMIMDTIKMSIGGIVGLSLENMFKSRFARMLCEFEKDYTFTTTAGRSLSSLFKFK